MRRAVSDAPVPRPLIAAPRARPSCSAEAGPASSRPHTPFVWGGCVCGAASCAGARGKPDAGCRDVPARGQGEGGKRAHRAGTGPRGRPRPIRRIFNLRKLRLKRYLVRRATRPVGRAERALRLLLPVERNGAHHEGAAQEAAEDEARQDPPRRQGPPWYLTTPDRWLWRWRPYWPPWSLPPIRIGGRVPFPYWRRRQKPVPHVH